MLCQSGEPSKTRSPPSVAEAGGSFALRIERSMAGLARLGGWVDGLTASLHLEAAAAFALRLCLEEAATNVVMHGAPDGGDAGFVALHVTPRPEALEVTVEDRCGPFDPLTVPSPALPTGPEDAQVGGLGIHLMRQYARSIRYDRIGEVNRLTLTIPRTKEEVASPSPCGRGMGGGPES